jgi:hypothetical protein
VIPQWYHLRLIFRKRRARRSPPFFGQRKSRALPRTSRQKRGGFRFGSEERRLFIVPKHARQIAQEVSLRRFLQLRYFLEEFRWTHPSDSSVSICKLLIISRHNESICPFSVQISGSS